MSYNKYYESWFRGNNTIPQGSGYSDNISLRNDGKTELRGDTYITNNGRLMVNKDKNTTSTYQLDVNGTSNFIGDLYLSNYLYCNYIRTIGSLLIGNPAGETTNLLTGLTIGSANPFSENQNNPSGGISAINIQTKRGGTLSLGSSASNNGGNINITAGQYTITLGGGVSGVNGIINIGANSGGYYNTVNLATGTSNNVLNLGSATSTINLLGNLTANTLVITPTLIGYLSGLTGNIQSQIALLATTSSLSSYALLASPAFTGNPTTTTQLTTDNSTRIASTAYVKSNLSSYALLASPAFTGNPTTTTQATTDNSTRIASTAYVKSNLSSYASLSANNSFTGICNFPVPNDSGSVSIAGGLRNNTGSGLNNFVVGSSLINSTTSDYNLALGNGGLNSVVSGCSQNLSIGYRALEALTSGSVNIAIGFISGYTLTSGNWNTFFSVASGAGFATGNHNFAMGFQTIASYNAPDIAKSTNVNYNLALGSQALTICSNNIQYNTAIGFNALGNPFNTTNASLKGNNNIGIGAYAGYGLDGTGCNNNVFIGYNTGVADGTSTSINTNTYTNITAFNTGVLSSPSSNSMYFGNSSVSQNYFNGNLNIPNAIFTNLPTCSATPTTSSQLITKAYADSLTSNILSSANVWTGTNSFNTNLPTSSLTPTTGTQLITKTYGDGLITSLLSSNNSWSGTNTFTKDVTFNGVYTISYLYNTINYNSSCASTYTGGSVLFNNTSVIFQTALPTTTGVSVSNANQLIPRSYVDGVMSSLFSSSNTFTGTTNTFNSVIANNQYINGVSTLTSASSVLSSPFYKTYVVSSTVTSITLPTASSVIGLELTFILANGASTATITINITSGSGDFIYTFGASTLLSGNTSYNMGLGSGSSPNNVLPVYQTIKATQTNVWNVTSPTNVLSNTPSLINQNTFSALNTFSAGINLYDQNLTSCFNITSTNYTVGPPIYTTYYINPSLTTTPTITLPLLSATQPGTEFDFYLLNNTFTATINRQGSDTIVLYNNSTGITPSTSVIMTGAFINNLTFVNMNGLYWIVKSPSQIVANIISGSTNIIQQNQYVNTAYNAVISTTTFSLGTTLYSAYSFQLSSNCVVTLPVASTAFIGCRILFRRVGTTTTTTLTSASSNVYPLTSNTAGTTLLQSGVYSVSIICLVTGTGTTYGWFIAN